MQSFTIDVSAREKCLHSRPSGTTKTLIPTVLGLHASTPGTPLVKVVVALIVAVLVAVVTSDDVTVEVIVVLTVVTLHG